MIQDYFIISEFDKKSINKYPILQHANTNMESLLFLKEQERAELESAADTDAFSPVL